MLTKMQKWGNSQGLRIPKIILEETKIGVGDEVEVFVKASVKDAAGNQMGSDNTTLSGFTVL
ncbi:MAG: AbrB/MazE/SpoVT family DNA-binding domain-containing protein [SAR324 cluster bacterium]|jgi:hypothetical protein|nr:AbrB/MazE/SpoVT family DNA-binding domain-containing protein [SAR324 cluster bacterium]MCH2271772.1 AbrB/MazE/SpoVT family DNA-binding domain-containing protein [SAR324 cluster bacterium]